MKVDPRQILELNFTFAQARILESAIHLGVFEVIRNGKRTLPSIAKECRSSKRGISMLLNALVSYGYLKRTGRNFSLTPITKSFLLKDSKMYLGDSIHIDIIWDRWKNLSKAVKLGYPPPGENETVDSKFFKKLVPGLFARNLPSALILANELKKRKADITSVLDVAAGSGPWGIGIAKSFRKASVAALDYPEILKIMEGFVRRNGLSKNFSYITGDLQMLKLGKEKYDLVILGHICHSIGERSTINLIKKSHMALKKGGYLAIAEFLPDDDRKGPPQALVFALNMLVATENGDAFTLKEYKSWLKSAGFKSIDLIKIPGPSPLILAKR